MYETGNPVPSSALEDMADNAQTFDALVTKTDGTTTDRLGRTRRVFQQIIMDMGFEPLAGSFQSGATLTQRNQVLQDTSTGVFYSWNGTIPVGGKVIPATSTPATSGGIGAGAWVDRSDATLRAELSGNSGSGIIAFFRGVTNSVKIWIFTKLSKTIDVEEFGVIEGITTDQSVAMQKAVDHAGSVGGVLRWPANTTFYGRIDFSNITKRFIFDAQGSVFAPAINTANEVFYALRSSSYPAVSGEFSKLPVTFIDTNITSKLFSATSDADPDGHTNYGVNFICTSAEWVRSSWQYGKIASYHGYYHQYGVFYDCTAGASIFSDNTAGMLLDGNTSNEASNENRIYGIKLFSNKNGLVIRGGIKNRIYTPTVQDTRHGGQGGIYVTDDSSGFGADGTEIHGVYSELNNGVPCVRIGVAANTTIDCVEFLSGGEYIDSYTCYNISIRDVNGYGGGGSITLQHPESATDSASVSVFGGNIKPSVSGLSHNGKTVLSISQPAIQNYRNDSMLGSTESLDQGNLSAVFIPDWYGVKTKVSKGAPTALCTITFDPASISQYRVVMATLELWSWDDADSALQFGYSGHSQRYAVLISTNTSGNPQVMVTKESSGIEVGFSTAFQSVGDVNVTSSTIGNTVTFYASWPGAGTGAAGMSLQSVAYCMRGAGTNSFYLTRL